MSDQCAKHYLNLSDRLPQGRQSTIVFTAKICPHPPMQNHCPSTHPNWTLL